MRFLASSLVSLLVSFYFGFISLFIKKALFFLAFENRHCKHLHGNSIHFNSNPTFRAIKKVPVYGTFSILRIFSWYHFGITFI